MTRVIAMVVEEVSMAAESVPEWLRPVGGLTADDLDRLPDLPEHTELIDGGLVFMSPQRLFHMLAIRLLEEALNGGRPAGLRVRSAMTVTLAERTRVEPDLLLVDADAEKDTDLTGYQAGDVLLAVEVVSPESEERDRERKPQLYAQAGIRHFWRVEEIDTKPVVFEYEFDAAIDGFALTGVHHDVLKVSVPFPVEVELDLTGL